MPIFATKLQPYKPRKEALLRWDNFRGGLNTLLRDTEIGEDELAQAYNLMLIGKGVPTKRWGTKKYFDANATGSVRGLFAYYPQGADPQLLAITDQGYLTQRDGSSYASINGASWASGYNVEMEQLEDKVYLVGEKDELKRYSNPTLVGFATIAVPSSVLVTQLSGPSLGADTFTYRVSALSDLGETLAASAVTLADQKQDLSDGLVKVSWGAVTDSKGYNIYGRTAGDERFLGSVREGVTEFRDDGSVQPSEFTYPPLIDTTGGFKAKYVIRFQDRLVFAGIDGEPSKVIITGRVPFQEKLHLPYGNFIRVEPDAGDDITGLGVFGNRIIVFKERSVWQVTLRELTIGNFTIFDPVAQLITASHGCVSQRTVVPVENDIFFLSHRGVYALGYEPNIAIDVLRTNEISVKIRDFFDGLSATQKKDAAADYHKNQYVITIPGKNRGMTFDRERLAWMGPWSKDARILTRFFDANDKEIFVSGEDDSPKVVDWSEDYTTDEDSSIDTILKTKREDFGEWALFKQIGDVFFNLKNVTGKVDFDLKVEDRTGTVVTAKSFTIAPDPLEGQSGFGADPYGNTLWGDSEASGKAPDTDDFVKWAKLNQSSRNLQVVIETDESPDDYELLAIHANARLIGPGFKGTDWSV